MKLEIYQIDAFAEKLFKGNPAAVVPLEKWISDDLMQNIGTENNLAETAFFVPSGEGKFDIRWFTPESEINLCGHATLASAFVLYNFLGYRLDQITFNSKSGPLYVSREATTINLDFPSWVPEKTEDYPGDLLPSLHNPEILGVYKNRDILVELPNEEAVRKCNPDFSLMKTFRQNVIVTAPGKDVDFVSRFFCTPFRN